MTNPDRLHSVPDKPEEISGADQFVRRLHLQPEAAQSAFEGANMLLAALRTAQRPELSPATKTELEHRGTDLDCVVVDETGGATVYNSPEQADMANYGPGWTEALQIVLATRRAPQ